MKKISELSPQSKKILAAELDGYVDIGFHKPQGFMFKCLSGKKGSDSRSEFMGHFPLKEYDKDYGDVIGLIQKLGLCTDTKAALFKLFNLVNPLEASVSQLLDALLVASGKAEL